MNHFEGKDALQHILDKKEEIHGTSTPDSLALAFDSGREIAILLAFVTLVFSVSGLTPIGYILTALACGWIAWKTVSTAWIAWFRLERFHRVIEQEKYEIEHHRPQEREELVALYSSKGFHGKLLQDVVDTLMAEPGRLLKVMLEEEMGLQLEAFEHPLKQAFGAFIGAALASCIILLSYFLFAVPGAFVGAALVLMASAIAYAKREQNALISACIWALATASFAFGIVYFLIT